MIAIDHTRWADLPYIQKVNFEVAEKLFPDRTPATMLLKLYSEVGELVANPNSGDELADILIMLLDHAERTGLDIGKNILGKLEVNLNRRWVRDPRTGVFSHA
jgi:hypothetical protein